MIAFSQACDDIARTPSRTAKVERLAAYFRSLDERDLPAAARFVGGNPLGARDGRRLAIGGRTLVSAARAVWQPSDAEINAAFRSTGDLGEALSRIAREPRAPELFGETLRPAGLATLLDELASASGTAAGKRRTATCERAFRACRDPREVAYLTKILLGELRIGLREGLVLEAVALAFAAEPVAVRRAAMFHGDVGDVAIAARHRRLDSLALRYGSPIGFMLATPLAFGTAYRALERYAWLAEDKYDGIRAQAHVERDRVRLFSRSSSDISRAFPEIVAAFQTDRDGGAAIFDGEIVAWRDGSVLPFRYLQARLGRTDPPPQLQAETPVRFIAFDMLAQNDRFVLDDPLTARRAALERRVRRCERIGVAPAHALADGAASPSVQALFEAARARGNEGLMLKRLDSPYAPGRRGKWWFKLKRELATLDAVVVGVEWGHGKRHAVLSDYTFAVRRSESDCELLPIGKAYSGLDDHEIGELTTYFLAHKIGAFSGHAIAVEPSIVIEVAFDVVQRSKLHRSGFALRFPRIVRLRPDKTSADIDTLEEVERIYREMLAREGVER